MIEDKDELPIANTVYKQYFGLKFISYVVYLLVSRYYSSYVEEVIESRKKRL
jgi:hypothetical protein